MQVIPPPDVNPSSPLFPSCTCRQQQQLQLIARTPSTPSFLPARRHLGSGAHGLGACAGGGVMCSGAGDVGGSGQAPRQTPQHLWQDKDRLGKGASCDVYRAVEKGTGRPVALKVLRDNSPAPRNQLLQEAETLSKLSNANVVQYYGHTYEIETGLPAVALELCTGGSLLFFLQQPEQSKGMGDADFRGLLADLVDGLSYLRAKGMVHRDIKPGNILRCMQNSGKCQYKLSDFGTSREATDTEQMTSIVGTEEYLHPVLYKKAFFGHSLQSTLNPTSGEMWSLGCTLYHAMTASVPFRPLGGARNNRNAMLVMISQKPPGAISGDQAMDGNFRWSTAPPADCRMSESLREKVVPLVQNLLETDPERQWTFATFLDESQRINGLCCLHVCDTQCAHVFPLYMEPRQSLAELQDALAYHTELPAGHQLLYQDQQPLFTSLTTRSPIREVPLTSPQNPLLLLASHRSEGRCGRHVTVQPSLMSADTTLEEDVATSFKACGQLHVMWQMAATIHLLPSILFSALLALRHSVTSALSGVESRFRVMSAVCQERQSRLGVLTQMMETLAPSPGGPLGSNPIPDRPKHPKLNQATQLCDQLRDGLWRLKYRLDESRRFPERPRCDHTASDAFQKDNSCDSLSYIFTAVKEIWQSMQNRRTKVPLPLIEQEKHRGEKASLNKACMDATSAMKKLHSAQTDLLLQYNAEVSQLCERLEVIREVDEKLLSLKEQNEQFASLLDQIWVSASEHLQQCAGQINTSSRSQHSILNQFDDLLSEDLPTLETLHLSSPDISECEFTGRL